MGNNSSRETQPERPVVQEPPRVTRVPRVPIWEPIPEPIYEHRVPVQRIRQPVIPIPSRAPCLNYARGRCTRGNSCAFAHDGPGPSTAPPAPQPCRFFAKGRCNYGTACKFSHDVANKKENKNDSKASLEDNIIENWSRELGGAWAKFGDGAIVTKISLPSDFSAIRISNLPSNASVKFVMDLLSDVRITVSTNEVKLVKSANQNTFAAIVKVENPKFANMACQKLRTSIAVKDLEVGPIPVPMPQGSRFGQVDSRKVHLWWHRPTRSACLKFESNHVAHQVQKKFRTGTYRILTSTVVASRVTQTNGDLDQPRWVVTLNGLPESAAEHDITKDMNAAEKSCRVEMGDLNYVADMEIDATLIKSMLDTHGLLDRWEISDNSKGKRVNAHATFFEESHATEAASALNNIPLPFCRSNKLFANVVMSVQFQVSTRVYKVIQNSIDSKKVHWSREYIQFFAKSSGNTYILKLEGDNREKVALAQRELKDIVSGQVMMLEGKNISPVGLKIKPDDYKRVKQLEQEFGIVILRDVRSSQFRVFGPKEVFKLATHALHRLIQNITSTSYLIRLEKQTEVQWAVDGGVETLESELGPENIIFDPESKCILIHGTEEHVSRAKTLMGRREPNPRAAGADSENCCPICFCEPEEPVRTSCNHVYCGLCFANMCQAGTSSTKEFRITCEGDSGNCGKSLPLPEIQSVLLSETFEDILAASFASHIRRHPNQFRYCPTPDCDEVYRVAVASTDSPATFTCKKCLASTCTACHLPHPGITCSKQKGDPFGGTEALRKAKEKLGIKDCPDCGTAIEKVDGCNHMSCRCGAHICWLCLATFKQSKLCYDHMSKVHGGFFT